MCPLRKSGMVKKLFKQLNNSILIDCIANLDFNFFKQCPSIVDENKELISSYYKLEYKTIPQFYHAIPLYNDISEDLNYKFAIISVNNDEVFISFNIIQIVKTQQIRLIGNPISKCKNSDNELLVLCQLLKLPFIKLAVSEDNAFSNLSYKRLTYYDDYYIDVSNKVFTSKYRSKYGINKIINLDAFRIDIFSDSKDTEKLQLLCDSWECGMANCNHAISPKSHNVFMKFLNSSNKNIIKIVLYYLEQPISLQIVLVDPITSFQYLLYINHIGRNKIDDVALKTVAGSMTEIQIWLLWYSKNLGIFNSDLFFIAGCRPKESRLLTHKKRISDGVIKYLLSC